MVSAAPPLEPARLRPAIRNTVLLLFSRYPEPGKTKSRLIPVMGAAGAADLQRQMTEHVLSQLPPPPWGPRLECRYTGGDDAVMRAWLGDGIDFAPQGKGTLGERMWQAIQAHATAGRRRIVVVGADCPGLDYGIVLRAIALLDRHDVVLGPAEDGGYYLIGCTAESCVRRLEQLFQQMPWGGEYRAARNSPETRDDGASPRTVAQAARCGYRR